MIWLFFVVSLNTLAPSPARAAEAVSQPLAEDPKDEFRWAFSLAADVRWERISDQSVEPRALPSVALGWGVRPWLFLGEYSYDEAESEGSAILNIRRRSRSILFWGQYQVWELRRLTPFFSGGLGARQEKVDSVLYSESRTDEGRWLDQYGVGLGLRFSGLDPLWLSLEGRVLFCGDFEPNPQFGTYLRLGFFF
ncbi:MAG: hypothetical protein C5B49_05835 [Bdellovibrio sp.]|nr:MAG: hypothetical protein C5B49_05835 [Bdellovibrio sp.]